MARSAPVLGMSSPFRHLEVFGDSISDVGNASHLLGARAVPCPPHHDGRLSNGPLWVECLAERLGLPVPTPSRRGGTGHAHGGARSATGFAPFSRIPNLREQIRSFLERRSGLGADGAALHVVRAGANDYRDVGWPIDERCSEAINGHLLAAVSTLAEAGARCFLVPSEVPWCHGPSLPAGCSAAERDALAHLIQAQNDSLRERLLALAAERELWMVQPDTHGLIGAILAAPADYGLHEVVRAALPDHPDGRGFLWWDERAHLTAAVHDLIAERAHAAILEALPVPCS